MKHERAIPTGWQAVKLGDVITLQRGFDLSKNKRIAGKYPLMVSNGQDGTHNEYKVKGHGVVTGRSGTLGNVFYIEKDFWPLNTTLWVKDFHGNSKKFVYYFMQTLSLQKLNTGSGVPTLNRNYVHPMEVIIPPLNEQKAIAEILSSLDNKIDLLHRQNKTLESMAQTLFRKWFIEDVKPDWEEVELRQVINWSIGYSYRSKDLMPSNIALVTLKNFARDGSFRIDGFKEYVGRFNENQIVHEGDLVVAHTDLTQSADIVGNPTLVYKPAQYDKLVMTMDLMKIESNQEWLSKEFLYYLMKTRDFKGHCLAMTNGSTVLHLSRDAVPSFKFLLPDKNLIEKFSNASRDLVKKQFHNRIQILELEKMRDLLLPKLMSGKIKTGV